MSKKLKKTSQKQLSAAPVWTDQFGHEHQIPHMETRHLFHCLTMLWNNSMPVKTRPSYREYHFFSPRFQDRDYVRSVLKAMWTELSERPYLTPQQVREINIMRSYWDTVYAIKAVEHQSYPRLGL